MSYTGYLQVKNHGAVLLCCVLIVFGGPPLLLLIGAAIEHLVK